MSKRNVIVGRMFKGYAGIMLTFSLFCFGTAFSGAFSSLVNASESKGERYEVLYKLPHVNVKITPEVCDTVAQTAQVVKGMIDKGYSDDVIGTKLSEAALANLGDRNGWIAYHMTVDPSALANMRTWPKETSYLWMQQQFPDFTGGEYYQVYAGNKCDRSIGQTVKVLQVKRLAK